MKKTLIVIAGVPASGKTTCGGKIAHELCIPFFSKDQIKEVIYDTANETAIDYEYKRRIGIISYSILYTICEEIMKAGAPLIIEGNFNNNASKKIEELVEKYGYKSIMVKFGADIDVLHKRFIERDKTDERHPGLVADGTFDSFEKFKRNFEEAKNFKINNTKEIYIDTSDFSKVDIKKIIRKIKEELL